MNEVSEKSTYLENRLTDLNKIFCASSDRRCGFVGCLVTLYYKSKMAADAIFMNANNFGLDEHMSTKLGWIIKRNTHDKTANHVEYQYGGHLFSET